MDTETLGRLSVYPIAFFLGYITFKSLFGKKKEDIK